MVGHDPAERCAGRGPGDLRASHNDLGSGRKAQTFSDPASYDADMLTRRIFLGTLAFSAAVVTGCTTDTTPGETANLPDAARLLGESASAVRDVRSAHFTMTVNGSIPGISVQTAEGDLTREGGPAGGAKGTVKLTLAGQLIEGEFVLVDDSLYLKGPTGTFQRYPSSLTSEYYDPSAILDPDRGFAKVLTSITGATTEAREKVDGTSAYKITGRAGKDAVGNIVPGVESEVDITVWLDEDGMHLPIRTLVTFPKPDGEDAPTVDVVVSDLDKPVTVTPPA